MKRASILKWFLVAGALTLLVYFLFRTPYHSAEERYQQIGATIQAIDSLQMVREEVVQRIVSAAGLRSIDVASVYTEAHRRFDQQAIDQLFLSGDSLIGRDMERYNDIASAMEYNSKLYDHIYEKLPADSVERNRSVRLAYLMVKGE